LISVEKFIFIKYVNYLITIRRKKRRSNLTGKTANTKVKFIKVKKLKAFKRELK